VQLEKIGNREGSVQLSEKHKEIITSECTGLRDVDKLVNICNRLVCRQLKFAYKNDLNHRDANCVGYAKFHATALNYAFMINQLPYKARPVYGKAHLCGIDLHPVLKSILPKKYEPFFNNHDYTEIDLGDEMLYVDTSIQDLLNYKYFVRQRK
jgi:hypothetical protein